ncbi:plasmid partitioning protein RepB C-terminal domain-containing protein [Chelatococcus reniformis]|uniref:Chromosome partitioning protein ParB n=1 Tax=Chelatococcus reniformis TaxID=1494448 RepID=A0A916UZ69_9HYPH|nr:plasmid partitioning protein RepB C-terminal domain-containing protein [Chelatococcus reniformis]GGC95017.1 chromosome partitioning protein ParB [Chelatococcus reniformis]
MKGLAFELECVTVPIAALLPVRPPRVSVKDSQKYQQIRASVIEVGLVEPPVISRIPGNTQNFLLLDGHIRIDILKDLGRSEVECLISTDDEAFTFNKRISRLSAIQENAMVLKAVARGVSREKIARALGLRTDSIQRKIRLLTGICPEVVSLLKDQMCSRAIFEIFKRMKPMRQIEAAELMIATNNFSVGYATALLAGTPVSELVGETKPKVVKGVKPEVMARLEKELARLQQAMTGLQDTYGKEHLQLTVIKGYLAKLLGNPRVVRYLLQHRPEYLEEFQAIGEIVSFTDKAA